MTRLVVEAGFGSTVTTPAASITWTEITGFVDIIGSGISITRGKQDEQSVVQAGTCSFTVDNSDGRFTPGLASSPYYPNVKKNVPLRIRAITTAKNLMPNPSFESGVTAWTASGGASRASSATHVQHGSSAMLVTWAAAAGQHVTSPNIHGLDVGTTYTFSAYVWVPAGDAAVQLTVLGGGSGTASSTTGAFERISVTWTANATTHQVRVSAVGTPAASDQVWVDSCQIEEGSSATTFDSDGAQEHARYWGTVDAWPVRWKGLHATATITCTDIFKILGKGSLETMLSEEVLLDEPLGYYPLTEASDSSAAGDLSGTTAGPLSTSAVGSGGELSLGGSDAGPDGQGALTLTPVDASNGQFLTGDLGQDFETNSSSAFIFVEGWFSTSTVNRVICGLTSSDNRYQVVFSLNASGLFQIQSTRTGGTLTSSAPATGSLANGVQHHFVYDEETQLVWVDGVSYAVGVDSMFRLRHLTVGSWANGRLWTGQLSHLAFYAPGPSGDIAEYVGHYTTGSTSHVGEDGDVRAARIASYVSATVTGVGGTFGGVGSQAALGQSPLQHLQEVELAEGGILIADRASGSVTLQSRDVRYNPTSSLTLAHSDLDTDQVEFDDDDQKLINDVTASRPGGATQRVKDQASIDTYGPYQKPLTLVKETDNEVVDAANWLIQRFADPPPEMRQLPVDAYTLSLATYRALLDADVSDVFDVTGLPDDAPSSSATVTIEGYTETIRRNQHYINFHVSRTDTATVWVLNDTVYSVLNQTTRLAY